MARKAAIAPAHSSAHQGARYLPFYAGCLNAFATNINRIISADASLFSSAGIKSIRGISITLSSIILINRLSSFFVVTWILPDYIGVNLISGNVKLSIK